MIGWVVAISVGGYVIVKCMQKFWNIDVAGWLNHTAADAVERVLGYDARQFMHRAVSTVTMVRDNLINNTVVFTKKSALDTSFQKITIKGVAPTYTQDKDVIEEFKKKNEQINTFEYKG